MTPKDLVLAGAEARATLPRHAVGERFLKGPIPWPWLQLAMALPGRALHVAIHIWHLAGMKNAATVSPSLSSMGFDRSAASRGLRSLERAGLVAVARHAGRKPRVTLLSHSA